MKNRNENALILINFFYWKRKCLDIRFRQIDHDIHHFLIKYSIPMTVGDLDDYDFF